METQVNVNTETIEKRTISWLEIVLKVGGILAFLITAIIFLNNVYNLINENKKTIDALEIEVKEIKVELHALVDKHEFKDLEDKVNRQYSIFNERMTKDVDPMKTWIEFHKGWLDGSNFKR